MSAEAKAPCTLAEIVYEKPLAGLYEERLFGSDSGNTLWVKFSDEDGIDEWIGKFGTGHSVSARVDKAIEPDRFLISAGGFGYLVDATRRALLNHHFEPHTQDVAYDARTNRFIVADYVRIRVIENGNVVHASKPIALDGIRSLKVEGRMVAGLATTGYEGEESGFTFDLDTLEVKCPVDFASWDDPPLRLPPANQSRPWWKFW